MVAVPSIVKGRLSAIAEEAEQESKVDKEEENRNKESPDEEQTGSFVEADELENQLDEEEQHLTKPKWEKISMR